MYYLTCDYKKAPKQLYMYKKMLLIRDHKKERKVIPKPADILVGI